MSKDFETGGGSKAERTWRQRFQVFRTGMHEVSAHSNLERLVSDSIGFSVLKRALI